MIALEEEADAERAAVAKAEAKAEAGLDVALEGCRQIIVPENSSHSQMRSPKHPVARC